MSELPAASPSSPPEPAADSPPSHLAALTHRNFRLLWGSQLVSLSGSLMQNAAILWHVSLLAPADKRGLALGLVGLVRIVPILAFSLVSGVVADALDRRKLLVATQSCMLATAALLALITFGGTRSLWPVYLLTAVGSGLSTFDGPARQALLPNLVPRRHLPNAISLYSIMFQAAAVIGPAIGGLLIGSVGLAWVYALNAVSFLCVIVALLMMRDLPRRTENERVTIGLQSVAEGLRFVFRQPLIRSTMLLDFFATFFASASALLPLFAQDVLRVGARGYGLLSAAPSVGAIIAGVALVPLIDRIDRRGAIMLLAVLGYGAATVGFGLSRAFWLTFACLALTGATDTVSMVIRNIIRQLNTPDALRGRMTSVNMIFFMGGPQLGELEAGLVANAWGAPFSVVSGGVACVLAAAGVAWRTPALRAYRRETRVVSSLADAPAGQ